MEVTVPADEDRRVIHHKARKRKNAKDGEDGNWDTHDVVTHERSDDPEGNDGHNDERFDVALERYGDEYIDEDDGS